MDNNNLRILNDYLNQTIDALVRTQQRTSPVTGFSHSPFATTSLFGVPAVPGVGMDATGVMHSPYNQLLVYGGSWAPTPWGSQVPGSYASQGHPYLEQYLARGLSHSPGSWGGSWGVSPFVLEMARQQQLTQAIAARQSVLEAICRSAGIPV